MKIPCIKLVQPIGEFYLCSLNTKFLKSVTYSSTAEIHSGNVLGNQRKINDNRIKEIQNYVSTANATMPNTIILSANYDSNDRLEIDPDRRWTIENDGDEQYFINIPDDNLRICSIIDGQHRINGFVGSSIEMDLPCSVFIDLPPSLQAYIFSTINFNQQKVDKSLAYQLFGYQLDEAELMSWSPDILAVKISRNMNLQGPFKSRIELIKGKKKEGWVISSAAFIEGVVSLISGNSKKDKYVVNKKKAIGYGSRKDLKDSSNYPLRKYYIEGNDLAIQQVISTYFAAMEKSLWRSQQDDSIVFRTVGIIAQFAFLRELILQGKVTLDKHLSFEQLLEPLANVKLDDEYFSARTATKKRLLDLFKLKLGLISEEGLESKIIEAANI